MAEQNLIPLIIEKIIPETADTKSFVLKEPHGAAISYTPGQFLTFVFTERNGNEARRNYSLSSSPLLQEPLQITVKRIANGAFSRWLIDKAKTGDVLYTTGASGFFTLPFNVSNTKRLIFFAAGSGIAPVFALIKTVLHTLTDISVVLIYSNTSSSTTVFYDELKRLEEKHPGRLQIEFLFSAYTHVPRARLNLSIIERVVKQYYRPVNEAALFYLCGPFDYMRMITIVLRTEGVPENAIRKEIFNIERPANKPHPPDTLSHEVITHLAGREDHFTVQYPETILQTAKRLGVHLPYSCEAGQCGTCAATCVSGKVWMWRNDVLLDEEIAKGRVLTCTGYPVGGDVELRY